MITILDHIIKGLFNSKKSHLIKEFVLGDSHSLLLRSSISLSNTHTHTHEHPHKHTRPGTHTHAVDCWCLAWFPYFPQHFDAQSQSLLAREGESLVYPWLTEVAIHRITLKRIANFRIYILLLYSSYCSCLCGHCSIQYCLWCCCKHVRVCHCCSEIIALKLIRQRSKFGRVFFNCKWSRTLPYFFAI